MLKSIVQAIIIYLWQILAQMRIRFSSRRDTPIFRLPPEILSQIFSYLSVLSKVCLVLSCKAFLGQFKGVLKHRDLRFPGIPGDGKTTSYYELLTTSRIDLLFRLETRRWKYCSRCLKLHPRREFSFPELYSDPHSRYCKWPGIVLLCPCIRLTARGKFRLLRQLTRPPANGAETIIKYSPVPYHECSITNDRKLKVRLKLLVSQTETRQLVIHSHYEVTIRIANSNWGKRLIKCCPHHDVLDYIDLQSDYKGRDKYACSRCQTFIEVYPIRGRNRFKLEAMRILGREYRELGGETWRNQTDNEYREMRR